MRKNLLLVILSVVMLCPGWLGLSGLPLLAALVPLMLISGGKGASRREFWQMWGFCALAFGTWNLVTTWWIYNAAAVGAIAAVGIGAVWTGGFFMLYHYASKRVHRFLAYGVLITGWLTAEWLLTVGQVSFPWLVLGNGFAFDTWLVQWYDTTGVFGGSLWVLLCNILIYEAVSRPASRRAAIPSALAAAILPVAVSLVKYAAFKPSDRATVVTVVQPNIDPYRKFDDIPRERQADLLLELACRASAEVDWIITPETALADHTYEPMLGTTAPVQRFAAMLAGRYPHAQAVLGASTYMFYRDGSQPWTAHPADGGEWYDNFNTVACLDAAGDIQLRHKSVLLIGVEMTPYYRLLRDRVTILDMGGVTGQLGVDPEPVVFDSPQGVKAGAAVCWEGVFGGYMGGFVQRGAEIIFIISNDGWWGDTQGHRQLFAFSRLRAIELRRAVARSANTGVSGFISPRGEVLQRLGWAERGTLTQALPLENKVTFYARHGDYIAAMAPWGLLACLAALVLRRRR